MGNSASKQPAATAKNVINQASKLVMPSARNPAASPSPISAATSSSSTIPKISDSKSDSIVQDGQDPTFMANLNQLGQVQVPQSRFPIRTDNSMIDIMQRRKVNEQAIEDKGTSRIPITNLISARTLSNLLDERKTAKSNDDMRAIAKEYELDFELLEQLARHYNAPSISQKLPPKSVEDDTETHLACWVDPEWKHDQPRIA